MKPSTLTKAAVALAAVASFPSPSFAQGADPFLGQLMLVPYNFCPRGWSDASGQILSIAQNTALFSLLGTTYGGNGQTTFALPDLRGRVPISEGTGPGLTSRDLGEVAGSETETLTINQMPVHSHTALIKLDAVNAANSPTPLRNSFAATTSNVYSTQEPTVNYMKTGTVEVRSAGGSQPHNNMQPYLTLKWCIAVQGIFPSRN